MLLRTSWNVVVNKSPICDPKISSGHYKQNDLLIINSWMKDWKVFYAVRKPIADFASKSQNNKRQVTNTASLLSIFWWGRYKTWAAQSEPPTGTPFGPPSGPLQDPHLDLLLKSQFSSSRNFCLPVIFLPKCEEVMNSRSVVNNMMAAAAVNWVYFLET